MFPGLNTYNFGYKGYIMKSQETTDYYRIASAIEYIIGNFKNQPSLENIADIINLSSSHFQRMFTDWAGVSPKKFLQFISVEHAKKLLKQNNASLLEASWNTGLSGSGRLHDLFVNIVAMTPGEYKNGGMDLTISYDFTNTLFGRILVAATQKGICHLSFADEEETALTSLKNLFPNAHFKRERNAILIKAIEFFRFEYNNTETIRLHLKGTPFQLKVWEALLKIPVGNLTTYGNLADKIGNPKASRAVGSAVGDNPVAYLIPCHRVIQSSGIIGQYHWGSVRKTAIIGWEASKTSTN